MNGLHMRGLVWFAGLGARRASFLERKSQDTRMGHD